MKNNAPNIQEIPLKMVGSNQYGRFSKISMEETFNMVESGGWLVSYLGYESKLDLVPGGQGRGDFASVKLGREIAVISNSVFSIDGALGRSLVGVIDTSLGAVSIAENDVGQIAICDQSNIYIYDYVANTFNKITTDFIPIYVAFQNGYFIAATGTPEWRLSAINDGTSWPATPNKTGSFQTKPDNTVACVPLPGKGNNLLVFGETVVELWTDVGAQLFPYQRNSAFNIDYGCLSSETIASLGNIVVWLGGNEQSGATIMFTNGGDPRQLQEDGINYRLDKLVNPARSYGFLIKQAGHIYYQLTFSDPEDNWTLLYDFTLNKFYTLTDQHMNYHIARRVSFFNNKYYFVSENDGKFYQLDQEIYTYDGDEIPRIRVCPTVRSPDTKPQVIRDLSFPIEQGQSSTPQRVDVSISYNSEDFGSTDSYDLNEVGHRQNRFVVWNLGYCNEFIPQFRFWGRSRFVVGDGVVSMYR
jgi:hypothetical protein